MAAGTRVVAAVPSGDGTAPAVPCAIRVLQGLAVLAAVVVFGFAIACAWTAALDSIPSTYDSPTMTGCGEPNGVPCENGGAR